jgi:arylsulfatase A-like enzyme
MGNFDAPAAQVQASALDWLTDAPSDSRNFLYIHTIDPHTPYALSNDDERVGSVGFMRQLAESRETPTPVLIAELIDLYDDEIVASDHHFSELLDTLQTRGLYDRSLIVVMSDHGEEFFEHGSWTHGRTLHRESLHVPLLIKFPDRFAAGTRVTETVQQIDLLPTLLDYLEIPPPTGLRGRSLLCSVLRALGGATEKCSTGSPGPIFAGIHYYSSHWQSVVLGDWKLILRGTDRLDREAQLFNRRLDPGERLDVAADHPIRVGYLTALLRREMRGPALAGASRTVELDTETRERLEALGYLN